MKKLLIIFVSLTLLAFAEVGFCGTAELVKLLGSREFWSSYPWGRYEDSALYRTTDWRPSGFSMSGDVKTGYDFSARVIIDSLPVQEVRMFVDAETGEATRVEMYSSNRFSSDDYQAFVNWCRGRFGAPEREVENAENLGSVTRTSTTSFWPIDNTQVTVRTENNLSNGPASVGFITTLSFTKRYRPSMTVTTGTPPGTTSGATFGAHPVVRDIPPVVPRNEPQRRGYSAPALLTSARPGMAVSAVPAASSLPESAEAAARPAPMERYQPPPYIWEGADGAMTAVNDIADVPEDVRPQFELKH